MKYILDFDGVISNTEALKKVMGELQVVESSRSGSTFTEMQERIGLTLNAQSFLFKDAVAFLKEHAEECVVISSYQSINPDNNKGLTDEVQKQYQEAKMLFSGIADIIGKHNIHIVGISKKEKLAELQREYTDAGEGFCFVDDREVYINEAIDLGIPAYVMNRSEKRKSTFEGFFSVEKRKIGRAHV